MSVLLERCGYEVEISDTAGEAAIAAMKADVEQNPEGLSKPGRISIQVDSLVKKRIVKKRPVTDADDVDSVPEISLLYTDSLSSNTLSRRSL